MLFSFLMSHKKRNQLSHQQCTVVDEKKANNINLHENQDVENKELDNNHELDNDHQLDNNR